jgi:hypothetical protein
VLELAGTAEFRGFASIKLGEIGALVLLCVVGMPMVYTYWLAPYIHRLRPAWATLLVEPHGVSHALRYKYLPVAAAYAAAILTVRSTGSLAVAALSLLPFFSAATYLALSGIADLLGKKWLLPPSLGWFRGVATLPLLGILVTGSSLIAAAACPTLVSRGVLLTSGDADWLDSLAWVAQTLFSTALTLDLFELAGCMVTPIHPAGTTGFVIAHLLRAGVDLTLLGTFGALLQRVHLGKLLVASLAHADVKAVQRELTERLEDGIDLHAYLQTVRDEPTCHLEYLAEEVRHKVQAMLEILLREDAHVGRSS